MRDVIVIGSGGGGPVVAKELAERGLDVLMLEAGARNAAHRGGVGATWRATRTTRRRGYFRFGPSDLHEGRGCASCRRTRSLAGQRRGRHDAALLRELPARGAGRVRRIRSATAATTAHEFPFSLPELVPYYEWAELTLPVQTAAMGTKEEVFLRGRGANGPAAPARQGHRAGTRTARRRTRSSSRRATPGRTGDPAS